jgi:hypothetical protein
MPRSSDKKSCARQTTRPRRGKIPPTGSSDLYCAVQSDNGVKPKHQSLRPMKGERWAHQVAVVVGRDGGRHAGAGEGDTVAAWGHELLANRIKRSSQGPRRDKEGARRKHVRDVVTGEAVRLGPHVEYGLGVGAAVSFDKYRCGGSCFWCGKKREAVGETTRVRAVSGRPPGESRPER